MVVPSKETYIELDISEEHIGSTFIIL